LETVLQTAHERGLTWAAFVGAGSFGTYLAHAWPQGSRPGAASELSGFACTYACWVSAGCLRAGVGGCVAAGRRWQAYSLLGFAL